MNLPLKQFADVAQFRNQVCDHYSAHWTGKMPCTGVVHCDMCGTNWNTMEEMWLARQVALDYIKSIRVDYCI